MERPPRLSSWIRKIEIGKAAASLAIGGATFAYAEHTSVPFERGLFGGLGTAAMIYILLKIL